MKSYAILLFSTIYMVVQWGCGPSHNPEITVEELRESINFLASDSLKGRYPGTDEDGVLTGYIINQFDDIRLETTGGYGLQEVIVERGYQLTENNRIYCDGSLLVSAHDASAEIMGFSASDTVSAELVVSASPEQEFGGSIVMLKVPSDLPSTGYDAFTSLRSLCLKASDNGASGVLLVGNLKLGDMPLENRQALSIPAAVISPALAESILGQDLSSLLEPSHKNPVRTGKIIQIRSEVSPKRIETNNTVAVLQGKDPELSGQYVIIGAHHDHLGMGGRGSSSRRQDISAIHFGADDNASGVAGVIELAQNIAGRKPSRSFVFTTFAAEEMGLFGSKAFTEHPVIELDKVQAMINLDMIGRMNEERQVQIGGVGTSPAFRPLIDSVNKSYNFTLAYSEAGYGPSDHSSFYAKDVPVLFISTGAHTDYHTPDDRPDRINYEGMKEVLDFVSDLAFLLSERADTIEFTLAGPKESSGSRGRQGMVTFGLMPDVMYDGNEGMPVSFVTEGKPAAIGGMKGGDIIVAVDGKRVGNVHDYMARLSELKEGQTVVVSILRDSIKIDLLLKL